jgi:hypothetical protein
MMGGVISDYSRLLGCLSRPQKRLLCAGWGIAAKDLVGHLDPSLEVALHLMMMLKQPRRITPTRSGCLSLVKLLEAGGSHSLLGLSLTHFRL